MKPRDVLDGFAAGAARPRIIGHRGYSSRAPENTMAAFSLIREHGVFGVELDVHLCASGELVVVHDHSLERVGGVPLPIATTPLDQLREHDIGSWFDPGFSGERIPLLEEVLELLSGACFVDIEIKHHEDEQREAGRVEAETVRLVRRHGMARRCIVSSFDPRIVRRVRRIDREIVVGAIYASTADVPRLLRRSGARRYSGATAMKPHHPKATRSHVRAHQRGGRLVMPWTVDDEEVARSLAEIGVDAIITNRPGEIEAALRETRG